MANKRIVSFFLIGILAILVLFSSKQGLAGSSENVSGFAWSDNISWISFNNSSGGGAIDYGVNLDQNSGVFSGYAWSENLGWVSFNEADLVGCPTSPCQAFVLDTACPSNQCLVSGWAKIVSYPVTGQGWIKLRGTAQDGSPFGVWIDPTVYPMKFNSYAWSENVGWISFAGINYQVIASTKFNKPPQAVNLFVTPPNPTDYGGVLYPPVRVNWQFTDPDSGDTQAAFQIQVSTKANFSVIAADTGIVNGSATSYVFSQPGQFLDFKETYYWRIEVFDNNGGASQWVYPPSVPGNPNPPPGQSFDTPDHPYPFPSFDWTVVEPKIGEAVQFCAVFEPGVCDNDPSICYNSGQHQVSCNNPGTVFEWIVPPGNNFVEGTDSHSANPKIEFYGSSPIPVTLKITDKDGYGPVLITYQITLKVVGPVCPL